MKTPENPKLSIQPRTYRGVDAETIRLKVPMRRSGRPEASGSGTGDADSPLMPFARDSWKRASGNRVEPASSAPTCLTLECVRLPAATNQPGNPIVFLTGGPGISAIRQGEGRLFTFFDTLRRLGDVLLLDQRGCGRSAPPGFVLDGLALPLDRALTRDEVLNAVIEKTRSATDQLRARGIDPSAFNTNESADDVSELIRALYGIEARVALLGWSYGTHLAMTIMRRHPSLVSRAVLAGPEGPDHTYKLPSRIQRQLEEVAHMCRDDAMLGPLVPDLVATLRRVFERVEKEPVRVRVAGLSSEPREMLIGRFELEWMVAEGIGDTRFLRRMPLLFARMERDDFSMLGSDDVIAGYLHAFRFGMAESIVRPCVDCASGATVARRERIEREAPQTLLGRTTDFPFPEVCGAVGSPDLGDDFRTPRRSEVPVLFITGTLDCRTPAENVADLASFYPSQRHVVIEGAGHGDLLAPRATGRAIERFFRDGSIEDERVSTDTPFAFARPRPMLLYDGECAFCRRQVERLKRRAGDAVEVVSLQDAPARSPQLSNEALRRSVHLIREDGRVATGAEAVILTLAGRTGRHPYLWMYRRVPGFAAFAEWAYRRVASSRHRLPL